MDPASVLGVVGSILGVTNIIARSLKGLIGLQSAYKTANLLVAIIIGHLTTVKSALDEIGKWAAKVADTLNREQLLSDVERAVSSCEIIVLALEERIVALTKDSTENLSMKGKFKFALEEQGIKSFSDHLGNQVHALNLLITAANCQTNQARTDLLHSAETRQVIRQIEDDSSSYFRGDAASSVLTRRNRHSVNTEHLDRDFDFDHQLLDSKVYRQALQSFLNKSTDGKEVLPDGLKRLKDVTEEAIEVASTNSERNLLVAKDREANERVGTDRNRSNGDFNPLQSVSQRPSPATRLQNENSLGTYSESRFGNDRPTSFNMGNPQDPSPEQYKENAEIGTLKAEIEKQLRNERETKHDGLKLLLFGTSESGKSTLLKNFKLELEGSYSIDERESFRDIIFSNLILSMRVVLEAMRSLGLPLSNTLNYCHWQTIYMHADQVLEGKELPYEVGEAIIALRSDSGVQECLKRSREYHLNDFSRFWFENVERLMDKSYVPTDHDILGSCEKTTGVVEKIFISKDKEIRVFDFGGVRSERRNWIRCLQDVSIIIFTVDIACFDQCLFEDGKINRMQEAMYVFDKIVNSRRFVKTGSILLFTKVEKLKEKLETTQGTLSHYLPNFPKEGTLEDAKTYIAHRFVSLCEDPSRNIKVEYCSLFSGSSQASKILSHVENYKEGIGFEPVLNQKLLLCGISSERTSQFYIQERGGFQEMPPPLPPRTRSPSYIVAGNL